MKMGSFVCVKVASSLFSHMLHRGLTLCVRVCVKLTCEQKQRENLNLGHCAANSHCLRPFHTREVGEGITTQPQEKKNSFKTV